MSIALTDDGSVSTWGRHQGWAPSGNFKGLAAGSDYGLLLTSNGTIRTYNDALMYFPSYKPIYHPDLANVTAISAGSNYFAALLDDKTVVY